MNRISELFNRKKQNILSVFFTAGYPLFESTVFIAKSLQRAGVDMIEIGIPFSDPIADGPTIQKSNSVSLSNGMTVSHLLNQVKEIRKEVTIPIILMGYINPVMQFGFERFCQTASRNGVDGIILPDLSPDEYQLHYQEKVESQNLFHPLLISPTTPEDRIRTLDAVSTGFIYAVSSTSTTGAKQDFSPEQEAYFKRLQRMKLQNPFLIGFGISSGKTFSTACKYSSGAILGSAFINLLSQRANVDQDINSFISSIRSGA